MLDFIEFVHDDRLNLFVDLDLDYFVVLMFVLWISLNHLEDRHLPLFSGDDHHLHVNNVVGTILQWDGLGLDSALTFLALFKELLLQLEELFLLVIFVFPSLL